jgi:hypothetical protein
MGCGIYRRGFVKEQRLFRGAYMSFTLPIQGKYKYSLETSVNNS